jgi:GTP-binding protein LepA
MASPTDDLGPGEIGFITAGIKTVADCRVGDTITDDRNPAPRRCRGSSRRIPVVWCGLYPVDADDFEKLRDSLGKLRLNDASFTTSRRPRPRWASASAAGSSACCIWRSSRSG